MTVAIPETSITRRDFELCPALVRELQQMNDLMEYHISAMTRCTQMIEPSGVRGGGGDDRLVNSIEQLTKLVDKWSSRAGPIASHLCNVETIIQELPDSRQRIVLRGYYFLGKSWKAIGAQLDVSERRCMQIRDDAMKFLQI